MRRVSAAVALPSALAPRAATVPRGTEVFISQMDGFDSAYLPVGWEESSLGVKESCFHDALSLLDFASSASSSDLCHQKCSVGGHGYRSNAAPYFCDSHVPEIDDNGSVFFCADVATLKQHCLGMDDCYGVAMDTAVGNRGFLMGWGCAVDSVDDDWTTTRHGMYSSFLKTSVDLSTADNDCAMGEGIHVTGGAYEEAVGLYEYVKASGARAAAGMKDEYRILDNTAADGFGVWRVRSTGADCGWVLERGDDRAGVAEEVDAPQASDDVAAANRLFGHIGRTYDTNVCSKGKHGHAGFCTVDGFKVACGKTCDVPYEDWIVLKNARRLDELSLDDVFAARELLRNQRRLQFDNIKYVNNDAHGHGDSAFHWTTIYQVANPSCDGDGTPADYSGASWLDLQKWHNPVAVSVTGSCSPSQPWVTVPGKYCKHGNAKLTYATHPDQCYNKCTRQQPPMERNPFKIPIWTANSAKYCEGSDEDFQSDSQAFCLPREKCIKLCEDTPGCVSIDMHATRPQCYLSAAAPDADDWGCPTGFDSDEDWTYIFKARAPDGITTKVGSTVSKRVSGGFVGEALTAAGSASISGLFQAPSTGQSQFELQNCPADSCTAVLNKLPIDPAAVSLSPETAASVVALDGTTNVHLTAGSSYFVSISYSKVGIAPALSMTTPNGVESSPIAADYFVANERTLLGQDVFTTTSFGRCGRADSLVEFTNQKLLCATRCSDPNNQHASCDALHGGTLAAGDQVGCGTRWEMEKECTDNANCKGFDVIKQAKGGFVRAVLRNAVCNEEEDGNLISGDHMAFWNEGNWGLGKIATASGLTKLNTKPVSRRSCFYNGYDHHRKTAEGICGLAWQQDETNPDELGDCFKAGRDCLALENFVESADSFTFNKPGESAFYMFFRGPEHAPNCAALNRAAAPSANAGPLCGLGLPGSGTSTGVKSGVGVSRCSAQVQSVQMTVGEQEPLPADGQLTFNGVVGNSHEIRNDDVPIEAPETVKLSIANTVANTANDVGTVSLDADGSLSLTADKNLQAQSGNRYTLRVAVNLRQYNRLTHVETGALGDCSLSLTFVRGDGLQAIGQKVVLSGADTLHYVPNYSTDQVTIEFQASDTCSQVDDIRFFGERADDSSVKIAQFSSLETVTLDHGGETIDHVKVRFNEMATSPEAFGMLVLHVKNYRNAVGDLNFNGRYKSKHVLDPHPFSLQGKAWSPGGAYEAHGKRIAVDVTDFLSKPEGQIMEYVEFDIRSGVNLGWEGTESGATAAIEL